MVKNYILYWQKVIVKIRNFIDIELFVKVFHKIVDHNDTDFILYWFKDFFPYFSLYWWRRIRIFNRDILMRINLLFNSQNTCNNPLTINEDIIVGLYKILTSKWAFSLSIWKLNFNCFYCRIFDDYFWFKQIQIIGLISFYPIDFEALSFIDILGNLLLRYFIFTNKNIQLIDIMQFWLEFNNVQNNLLLF